MKNPITRFAIIAGLLGATAVAQAGAGWHLLAGASLGYADRDGDYNFFFRPTGASPDIWQNNQEYDDDGLFGGVFFGLQERCGHWLYGVELNLDWHNYEDEATYTWDYSGTTWMGISRIEQGLVVGLTGRLGYQMAPYFMPYIRLGVDTRNNDHHFRGCTDVLDRENTFFSTSHKHRDYGFIGGVGFEVPLNCSRCFTLRAEYNYHEGSYVSVGAVTTDGTTYHQAEVKPRTHSGRVSVVMNFL